MAARFRKKTIDFRLNGVSYTREVKTRQTLLEVLRDELGLMGTKVGCESGDCGSCTVLLNGKPVNSCLVLAVQADGCEVITVEGLEKNGKLDSLQQTFIEEGAVQCGFCTPGMLMSAKGLLDENPAPTEADVRRGIAGNLCRCTGYVRIVKAIQKAAETERGHR